MDAAHGSGDGGVMKRLVQSVPTVVLLAAIGYQAWVYKSLPANIPLHFTGRGHALQWGDKSHLFILAGVGLLFDTLMVLVTRVGDQHPELINLPVRLTPANRDRILRLYRILMLFVRVAVDGLLAVLIVLITQAARTKLLPLNVTALVVWAGVVLGGTAAFYVAMKRAA
jgi:uncharacterized membrane protein